MNAIPMAGWLTWAPLELCEPAGFVAAVGLRASPPTSTRRLSARPPRRGRSAGCCAATKSLSAGDRDDAGEEMTAKRHGAGAAALVIGLT
ncbi:MAG TPA: hypothetical protein VNO30_00815 [Kofleriaceae bacterium]|nr:hypothetical protein [Kofleriaceae bacterium]